MLLLGSLSSTRRKFRELVLTRYGLRPNSPAIIWTQLLAPVGPGIYRVRRTLFWSAVAKLTKLVLSRFAAAMSKRRMVTEAIALATIARIASTPMISISEKAKQ